MKFIVFVWFCFVVTLVLYSNLVPRATSGACRPSENIHSTSEWETDPLLSPRACLFDHGFASNEMMRTFVPKAQAPPRATQ